MVRFDEYTEQVSIGFGGTQLAEISFARQDLVLDQFVDVRIELEKSGKVSVQYDGQTIFDEVQTDFNLVEARGWRTAFAARTGGESTEHWVDSVSIAYNTLDKDALAGLFQPVTRNTEEAILGSNRLATGNVTAERPMILAMNSTPTYTLTLSTNEPHLSSLPFVEIDDQPYELEWNESGSAEIPVGENKRVRIGTRYRDDQRCYTLSNLLGQGILTGFSMNTAVDGVVDGKVTREYLIDQVVDNGSLILTYSPTLYRAEIPLGQALELGEAGDSAVLNTQLVPDLCEGGVLSNTRKPNVTQATSLDGSVETTDNAIQWDPVEREFFR